MAGVFRDLGGNSLPALRRPLSRAWHRVPCQVGIGIFEDGSGSQVTSPNMRFARWRSVAENRNRDPVSGCNDARTSVWLAALFPYCGDPVVAILSFSSFCIEPCCRRSGMTIRSSARPRRQTRRFQQDRCTAEEGRRAFGAGRKCSPPGDSPADRGTLRTNRGDRKIHTGYGVQDSGDRSRAEADKTAAPSGILLRLQSVEEKIWDTATTSEPIQQNLALIANRTGELARSLGSRLTGEDWHDDDVLPETRSPGLLVNRGLTTSRKVCSAQTRPRCDRSRYGTDVCRTDAIASSTFMLLSDS